MMNIENFNIVLMSRLVILPILVFLGSLFLIPKIRKLSLKLNFSDASNGRSSHQGKVASFGGVAFFLSYIFVFFFAETLDVSQVSLTLLASITIMFFTGLLDDMSNLSPKVKFFAQFIAVSFLMTEPDFRILSLHGLMGFYEIPLFVSVSGSMFFLLGLINAFNLIDGIDGLTGITGIIVASFYSYMFYELGFYYYLTISLATIATLIAFLRFNFSIKRKIFMGDTGSLVIGLVLGLLTFKLLSLEVDAYTSLSFNREQLPLFLIGVLFIPLLDTLRVMFLRAVRGVSMFKPDRNHIHHIIVDFGLSHRRASFFIGFLNFIVALIMFFVIQVFNYLESLLVLVSIFFIAILLLFLMNKNKSAIRMKLKMKKLFLNFLSL
ncbi:undecaprenyl/decaprenyl-phosphate alpha-N-acetylglucosaminyl 1-phosphate transferase, partial [Polaribacter sp.]|nr:undecaprenyl/decaprenyl-phosphate alpha-N-acetylglucosaminyl 1-phosphate transferase [Polaribacter sp.]MDC1519836.1 undecaprenyl/decaprenyl-phosphate alpha-N-acetylglucosaminyl 1-phosphate transferase [Polaribacter sp.]